MSRKVITDGFLHDDLVREVYERDYRDRVEARYPWFAEREEDILEWFTQELDSWGVLLPAEGLDASKYTGDEWVLDDYASYGPNGCSWFGWVSDEMGEWFAAHAFLLN